MGWLFALPGNLIYPLAFRLHIAFALFAIPIRSCIWEKNRPTIDDRLPANLAKRREWEAQIRAQSARMQEELTLAGQLQQAMLAQSHPAIRAQRAAGWRSKVTALLRVLIKSSPTLVAVAIHELKNMSLKDEGPPVNDSGRARGIGLAAGPWAPGRCVFSNSGSRGRPPGEAPRRPHGLENPRGSAPSYRESLHPARR